MNACKRLLAEYCMAMGESLQQPIKTNWHMNSITQHTRNMETSNKPIRNRVQLMGNLGKDPDLRVFDGGKKQVRFSLATNERFNFGDGQFKEDTQWHNIVAWGNLAGQASEQLHKGSRISMEGRLVHRTYEAKDGQKRYVTEVVMHSFQITESTVEAAA